MYIASAASAITSFIFTLISLGWKVKRTQILFYVRQTPNIKDKEMAILRDKIIQINTHIKICNVICIIFLFLAFVFGSI